MCICIYIYLYMYMYIYIYICVSTPWGGTGWLAGLRASVPSCVLKGYVGPYGALSPSAISCQLVRGVSGALKRAGRGSRMTPCLLSML